MLPQPPRRQGRVHDRRQGRSVHDAALPGRTQRPKLTAAPLRSRVMLMASTSAHVGPPLRQLMPVGLALPLKAGVELRLRRRRGCPVCREAQTGPRTWRAILWAWQLIPVLQMRLRDRTQTVAVAPQARPQLRQMARQCRARGSRPPGNGVRSCH